MELVKANNFNLSRLVSRPVSHSPLSPWSLNLANKTDATSLLCTLCIAMELVKVNNFNLSRLVSRSVSVSLVSQPCKQNRCHLPPLCIAMELVKVNNFNLAEQFMEQAHEINSMDPLFYNERGVIYYKNKK